MAEEKVRADARRNRQRVLDAAEAVLARDGLTASMRTVAAEAGVGLGTIYRHFPTQEALYQAIILTRTERLAAEAGELGNRLEPGPAFFAYFRRIVDSAAEKKALSDVVASAGLDPKEGLADVSRAMRDAIETLLVRAQRAKAVRDDVRMPDVLALLSAACLGAERQRWSPELTGRTLAFLFDGLRPTGPADLPTAL
ncbi:MAG: TetR/AcrR family transcriptional regulator [Streptomycetaceae bacterium]|nr:TetR/AcrR family transcriptional regulator [Streptomycetaceae bacterium]